MNFYNFTDKVVGFLQGLPVEVMWGVLLVVCFGSILGMLRLFGAAGLYMYITVAVIGANIQVLKAVSSSVYSQPVALGTILFTSTFLCTDILTEHYGERAARKGVYIGFMATLLMTVLMVLTVGFAPLDISTVTGDWHWGARNHESIAAIFLPAPKLFLAGMIAYLVSQLHDVWVFTLVKKITKGKYLWLRNNLSTLLSSLIDNIIFSVLAWVVLAKHPLPWGVVVTTYIFGTYLLRVIVALLDTPIMYMAKGCLPEEE